MNTLFLTTWSIARQLPSGLVDDKSHEKLVTEQAELIEAIIKDDRIGAVTELADVVYYAGKAIYNGQLSELAARAVIIQAANVCHVPLRALRPILLAKYATRIQGVKCDATERAAVQAALDLHTRGV